MNYLEFEREFHKRGLMHNHETIGYIEDAKVLMENVRRIKRWNDYTIMVFESHGVSIPELIRVNLEKKDLKVQMALDEAWKKEDYPHLGEKFEQDMRERKRTYMPRNALTVENLEPSVLIDRSKNRNFI